MKQIISLKIDLTKIDKERLFKSEKTGSIYLDAVAFIDEEPSQYGDNGMITQSVTKEEREAGTRGAILGNVKIIGKPEPAEPAPINDDDLPF